MQIFAFIPLMGLQVSSVFSVFLSKMNFVNFKIPFETEKMAN